jgi:hypothetical protein
VELHDVAWNANQDWTNDLDERGLAAYHELTMARAPLRKLPGPAPLSAVVLPGPNRWRAGHNDRPSPGRPGRRWPLRLRANGEPGRS